MTAGWHAWVVVLVVDSLCHGEDECVGARGVALDLAEFGEVRSESIEDLALNITSAWAAFFSTGGRRFWRRRF